jgi:hypothetical protein
MKIKPSQAWCFSDCAHRKKGKPRGLKILCCADASRVQEFAGVW